MNEEQELTSILWRWKEASERVEWAPGETCLTASEIADYVDDELEVAERERVADHLSQCSYCTREVGSGGTTDSGQPEGGDDRYYAMVTGMIEGTHYVTVLRPES